MGAVQDEFQGAQSKGCWFHYGQAVIKKAGKLHLSLKYRNGGVVSDIIEELICLALLPPAPIYEGFKVYQLKLFNNARLRMNIYLMQDIRQSHRRRLLRKSRGTQRAMAAL